MKRKRKLPPGTNIVAFLETLTAEVRRSAIALLSEEDRETLDRAWREWAHEGQLAPQTTDDGGEWSTWVIKAGRGFGKTLAGAQWLTARIAEEADLRIALVGATLDDARRVMVEGNSGLLSVAAPWIEAWEPSLRRLRFRGGSEAALFSGSTPRFLRGPEHHYAWCDELAKWERGQESWDMLQLGLRLGKHPRAIVTTTPRPGPVLTGIIADPATVVTGGPTRANPHLARAWHARVERLYAGTRLGRQELDGELLPDAAGALWTVELIEKCRIPPRTGGAEGVAQQQRDHPQGGGGAPASVSDAARSGHSACAPPPCLAWSPSPYRGGTRTLIAVDPPSGDGTCGIVACAREVVAEANQGGKMVKAVLAAADPRLRVKLVHASTGKTTRAEPIAHLCEAGRVRLHGRMPELEAELLGMIAGGGYEGPGTSPDRADAMVWGVSEVMRERAEARVWVG